MLELVFANLKTRPFRSILCILGVSLGVVLVTMFTGLTVGLSNDMAKRAANWKAELIFTRPGTGPISSSNTNVSMRYVELLPEIEGVDSVVPVIKYLSSNPNATWGVMQIDGVPWEDFSKMNEIKIVEGRAPKGRDEVVVDQKRVKEENHKLGDKIELFDRQREIVGIFAPPSGARIKLPIEAIQKDLETDRCTMILVKVKDGVNPDVVADAIEKKYPGNKIEFTRELVIDAAERIPGLRTMMNVLVFLGALVSTVFVLLSMYTTITERRKEIGILKSLGASRSYIIKVIEGEALLIGVIGVLSGLIISFVTSFLLGQVYDIVFEFEAGWIGTAALIALIGSLFGALYPAWKASAIDPVEVMVNE